MPTTAERTRGARPKAAVLVEAIPYIRRFCGKVVVVKYGGNALRRRRRRDVGAALARSPRTWCCMRSVGMLPVVVHGGGPQIGELMARLGKVPEFRDGLRVTDAETLDIARMVLVGKVNREIVGGHQRPRPARGRPVGRGRRADHGRRARSGARLRRRRRLGRPDDPRPAAGRGLIPVVATIGSDADGPGLQHQRRHRRRRARRGTRRREADLPHRRRRHPGATGTTRDACRAG